MTQSLVNQEIAYTTVSILYNSIPGWGRCHKRQGKKLFLVDTTVNGDICYKCMKLSARSRNVIQVHSKGIYQCFNKEEDAVNACPTLSEVAERNVVEIMLYKTRSFHGESAVAQVRCPINGVWRFTYSQRGGDGSSCASPASRAGDCPSGYQLDFQFKGCSFPRETGKREMHLRCLGDWRGEDGQRYLALMDTELPQLGQKIRPRYRCAIYKEDLSRGYTWMALSNDSTCTNQLDSHSAGYENLQLHSLKKSLTSLSREVSGYSLPAWSQGNWNGKQFSVKGGRIIYHSDEDMTTYIAQSLSSPQPDRYLIRLESACGRAAYACLALEQRATNIIEMMLGKQSKAPEPQLCSTENFLTFKWLTLSRQHAPSACPLQGEFSGALPDAEGLCARSVTSCQRKDLMQYQVFNCENKTEVYEDRRYLCYGIFKEGSLTYTVMNRLDLPGRECFVGVTLGDGKGMIAEAGKSCGRDKEPLVSGMMLSHQSDTCVEWELEETSKKPQKQSDKSFQSTTEDVMVIQSEQDTSSNSHKTHLEDNIEEIERSTTFREEIFESLVDSKGNDNEVRIKNKSHKFVTAEGIEKRESVPVQEYPTEHEYSSSHSPNKQSYLFLAVFLVIVSLTR